MVLILRLQQSPMEVKFQRLRTAAVRKTLRCVRVVHLELQCVGGFMAHL
jgi:hypothetical protein